MIIGFLTFFSDARKTHFSLYMWSAGETDYLLLGSPTAYAHCRIMLPAYPLGIFGVACTQFAIDFDSPAFRVISTAICILSVIYWIFLAVYTMPLLVSGELLLREAVEEEEDSQYDHVHQQHSSASSNEGNEHLSRA
jgi:hypothetical protein